MLKMLATRLLALLGWKTTEPPGRPPKAVMIAYPHTSNWDAFYALLVKLALGLDAHWAGKDNMFRPPFGGLLKKMGGVPVNRRERTGFVEQMVAEFAGRERFTLVIAPEGTRSLTAGWKSGFYRIAVAAQVPVALGFMDYAKREGGILAYLTLTGDRDADLAAIARHYAGHPGKRRELASPIRWLD
ncbi:MAG: glycerol acyltransferase [Betaproteobacteria bacterium]|nr:glycerol acyltransferase [Betaproteobacteria bacterium]